MQNRNQWKQGNTRQGLNDRGSDYGRSDYGNSAYRNSEHDNNERDYAPSQYGTSQFDRQRGRQDAESAFGYGLSDRPNRDNSYDQNNSYDRSAYTTNFGAGNTGNQSNYRNCADVLRTRGRISDRDLSQYAQNDFDNTRYGESEWDARSFDDGRYTTESNRQNSHFGKGPKGYKRSDARIEEDVHEALTHDHDIDASEIEVSVKDGIVTLSGSVSERKMKRLAEDLVEKISGVSDVRNEITTSSSFFGSSAKKDKLSNAARTNKSASNTDMM